MNSGSEWSGERQERPSDISVPAPTAWPLILAFGITLLVAGLVTTAFVSVLGIVLSLFAGFGWFREVLPHERHERVPVREETIVIATERHEVDRIKIAPELHRLRFPIEVYPISAGLRGGLAGSVVMAVVAMAYGLIAHGSIWYPINLLGAVVFGNPMQVSVAHLSQFNIILFLVALALHITVSLLVGVLYGAMLPMLPRHPIFLGGVVAPTLWSGLVYATLGIIDPLMNARINWWWFGASQVAFGLVAGFVVVRQTPLPVRQFLPFALRAGIEGTGMPEGKQDRDGNS